MFTEGQCVTRNFSVFLAKGIRKWECLKTLLLDGSNSSLCKIDFVLEVRRKNVLPGNPQTIGQCIQRRKSLCCWIFMDSSLLKTA